MSTNLNNPAANTSPPIAALPVVIREATEADRPALARLSERDSTKAPAGALVVAETGGALRAAVEIETGRTIADPFHRTAELVGLLRARVDQVRGSRRRPLRVVARTPAPDTRRRTLGRAA